MQNIALESKVLKQNQLVCTPSASNTSTSSTPIQSRTSAQNLSKRFLPLLQSLTKGFHNSQDNRSNQALKPRYNRFLYKPQNLSNSISSQSAHSIHKVNKKLPKTSSTQSE